MESKDAKKHPAMLCFNARSDSLVPYDTTENNNNVQRKRFSLTRFKKRCKRSDGGEELECLREEFDKVNRIRYDLESFKPIKADDSIGNCDGLVCLHNGSTVIQKVSSSNSLEDEGKSKSVDYLHEREKDDDSLSFLSVKSEIITASRRSSADSTRCRTMSIEEVQNAVGQDGHTSAACNPTIIKDEESSEQGKPGLEQSKSLENSFPVSNDTGNDMDPTPPNSPQEASVDDTFGTMLGEQNIETLKNKILKEIDRQTGSILEEDEEDEQNS